MAERDGIATRALLALAVVAAGCGSEVTRHSTSEPRDVAVETRDADPGDDGFLTACDAAREGATRCDTAGGLETCTAGEWILSTCAALTICDGGHCVPVICAPGEARCSGERARQVCNERGTAWLEESCGEDRCRNGGCFEGCEPGSRRCEGQDVLECMDDRETEALALTCDDLAGQSCLDGRCLSECEVKGSKRGYLACEFWAVDLPTSAHAINNKFSFAFSSGSARPATVTVTHPWGDVATVTVPVGGLATHALPVPRTDSQLLSAGLSMRSFRIESDEPIAAFMFNPLQRYDAADAFAVATSDASLIIPATALGHDYLALTYSDFGIESEPPYVTVVATEDGTEIEVVTTETIKMDTQPLLIDEGVPTRLTLQKGEVLHLEALSAAGIRRDLSGTRITSLNHRVAVFAGNRCARVPESGYYCDHLETQLPPLETWGTRFVMTKLTDRGGEADHIKILALEDGTELTFDPPRAAPVLDAGGIFELTTRESLTLESSRPVLVAQFLASQSTAEPPGPFGVSPGCNTALGGNCQGDPSMLLVTPIGQWRTDPIFLVPDTYRVQFVNIALATGTTLRLDGEVLDTAAARPIGTGAWRLLTVPVTSGVRTIVASQPIGVVVYGYDHNISYVYQAGLDFRPLWEGPSDR